MESSTPCRLTVYGARGSMAVSGRQYETFGGATSCYLVEMGGESIFLDAGSGLIGAPVRFERTPVILLSHLHLDHLLGLGMYPRLATEGLETALYLPAVNAEEAREELDRLYSPPFWPLSLSGYAGSLRVEAISGPFAIGRVRVETMPGSHPGGCLVFRLSCEAKSIVYATDYEHGDEGDFGRLAAFAYGTDLLMYDGQFTEEEFRKNRGFGHSTVRKGMELKERSAARQVLLIHHDPQRTDEELLRTERSLAGTGCRFGRQGEVIEL